MISSGNGWREYRYTRGPLLALICFSVGLFMFTLSALSSNPKVGNDRTSALIADYVVVPFFFLIGTYGLLDRKVVRFDFRTREASIQTGIVPLLRVSSVPLDRISEVTHSVMYSSAGQVIKHILGIRYRDSRGAHEFPFTSFFYENEANQEAETLSRLIGCPAVFISNSEPSP